MIADTKIEFNVELADLLWALLECKDAEDLQDFVSSYAASFEDAIARLLHDA